MVRMQRFILIHTSTYNPLGHKVPYLTLHHVTFEFDQTNFDLGYIRKSINKVHENNIFDMVTLNFDL